ncbi:MAG: hypothetical protein AAF219_02515 [Myxococcota bacterium]
MRNARWFVGIALAFVTSFASAYLAAGWVVEAISVDATEQVDTTQAATLTTVEC